jgi:heptosyltransferase-2
MWPLEYWQTLIKQNPQRRFLVTGGPGDADPATLEAFAPDNCRSLAGTLSWSQTLDLIQGAKAVIGVDTGTVHLGDLLGVPTFFLIGPTAFGFPTRSSSGVLEIPLSCRPCTKDGRCQCKIAETKKCLVDIRPDMVTARLAAL